jgi:hypothetical protein
MTTDRLYPLLPAVYRLRDAAQKEQLRALLQVIEEQLQIVEADISGLSDNWFVETCAEWVVPYIGDLLGVRGLHPVSGATRSERARVANTIAYRRRKGTAAMLEQLARDVTGWPAHAVEFFELLAVTQHLNHVRPGKGGTVDLGNANRLELLGGPFETVAHTGEVRHIDNARGRYNIPNVGLFLWRIQSYPISRGTARVVDAPADGHFTFNPLGLDAPLFSAGRTEQDITHLAGEVDIPLPLRRRPLYDELNARRAAVVVGATPDAVYFGERPSRVLDVFLDHAPEALLPEQILICNLSDWRRPPSQEYTWPNGDTFRTLVSVDPQNGRLIALDVPGVPRPTSVEVSYAYGFPGDLGGGPYDRQGFVADWLGSLEGEVRWQIGVTATAPPNDDYLVQTLSAAIDEWNKQPAGTKGVIALLDSRSYRESTPPIQILAQSQLLIVAADWPEEVPRGPFDQARRPGRLSAAGVRPHLQGDLTVLGMAPAESEDPGGLVIDGLLIEGSLTAAAGNLGRLELWNSTLVPGMGGLVVSDAPGAPAGARNERLTVTVKRAIIGPVQIAEPVRLLRLVDTIADAPSGAPVVQAAAAEIIASTILGTTDVQTLEASNSIFRDRVSVERRQVGCVRFCYVTRESLVPRRYRCQPVSAAAAERVVPRFISTTYGAPGYAQPASSCPSEIMTGADDEDEQGAFHFLQESQRLTNLRTSLDEYLRFGLEAGVLLET